MDESYLDKIPDRIKYYLLDWKDRNMAEFINIYGRKRLRDLNKEQIKQLFNHVSEIDSKQHLK